MKTLREDIKESSKNITDSCGCCSSDFIDIDTLFFILKERGINLD